jgi:hypothetical protein
MIEDKNRLYDGWLTLEGGVDAGTLRTRLTPTSARVRSI